MPPISAKARDDMLEQSIDAATGNHASIENQGIAFKTTDELTEMAYDVIVRTARVSDTLKAELGAMASRFQSERERETGTV